MFVALKSMWQKKKKKKEYVATDSRLWIRKGI